MQGIRQVTFFMYMFIQIIQNFNNKVHFWGFRSWSLGGQSLVPENSALQRPIRQIHRGVAEPRNQVPAPGRERLQ